MAVQHNDLILKNIAKKVYEAIANRSPYNVDIKNIVLDIDSILRTNGFREMFRLNIDGSLIPGLKIMVDIISRYKASRLNHPILEVSQITSQIWSLNSEEAFATFFFTVNAGNTYEAPQDVLFADIIRECAEQLDNREVKYKILDKLETFRLAERTTSIPRYKMLFLLRADVETLIDNIHNIIQYMRMRCKKIIPHQYKDNSKILMIDSSNARYEEPFVEYISRLSSTVIGIVSGDFVKADLLSLLSEKDPNFNKSLRALVDMEINDA